MNCPECGSENTQRLSVAYESGLSEAENQESPEKSYILQSLLSKKAEPPIQKDPEEEEKERGFVEIGCLFSLGLFFITPVFLGFLSGLLSGIFTDTPDYDVLLAILTTLCTGIFLFWWLSVAGRNRRDTNRKIRETNERYQREYEREYRHWEESWYCNKCGIIYHQPEDQR